MVFWQTSPFWTSIIAYFILNERLFSLEIVAICICFAAVAVIATQQTGDDYADDDTTIGIEEE